MTADKINFAIDRGGTFTDVYAWTGDGRVFTEKLLSVNPAHYPDAPAEGIRRVVARLLGRYLEPGEIPSEMIGQVRMGTTVATNALLERKGARCALVITRGFGDLLEIGYQNRPELFALEIKKPSLLYEEVIEIDERVRPAARGEKPDRAGIDGTPLVIEKAPDPEEIERQMRAVAARGIDSVAVVFMHAHLFPEHERMVGRMAREAGISQVSLSSEVNRQARIVRRGDTAMVDAYLSPLIREYLDGFLSRFREGFPAEKVFFMRSDGGLAAAGRFRGSSAILSGPAGGVTGCAESGYRRFGRPVIGFDMGGTSTDVCRYGGEYELTDESETAGVRIQSPQLMINTVAAGGGSRLFYRHGMFEVGPESAGADPGPVCYKKGGPLAVTDANLVLGRLQPEFFPAIFGKNADQPLDIAASRKAFAELAEAINRDRRQQNEPEMDIDEIAAGFIEVANQTMARPIREITVARGFDLRDHVLVCFGGAGGQHACGIAASLGIETVHVPRHSGILSAWGLARASLAEELSEPAGGRVDDPAGLAAIHRRLDALAARAREKLAAQGANARKIRTSRYLALRYEGTDTRIMVMRPQDGDYTAAFARAHQREFGFVMEDRAVLIEAVRVRAEETPEPVEEAAETERGKAMEPVRTVSCFFAGGRRDTPVFDLSGSCGGRITGPALLVRDTSTVVLEPGCTAEVSQAGDVTITLPRRGVEPERKTGGREKTAKADPVRLSVFGNLFMSVAEQMGRTLQRTAISTNIKERCDFSCAIFDASGNLVANAPHQPVHLGAMDEAVKSQIRLRAGRFRNGEVILSNHPAAGGSHLPDLTVITPVFDRGELIFFVANRGHHADIGGITPGSMPPFSKKLADEGVAIKSFTLVKDGAFAEQELRRLLSGARRPEDNVSDLAAQVAANRQGAELVLAMIKNHSRETVLAYMGHIQKNAEQASRAMLMELARRYGTRLAAADRMDDGTTIAVEIEIDPATGGAVMDFSGTGPAVAGNWNAPRAVTMSAVLYVIRLLIAEDIPLNHGCLAPLSIRIPPGSILDPPEDAAVAGGNVLTSQRIVDVLLRAFRAAAASQGCMNNLTIGDDSFGYYETIGGGSGAGPGWRGADAVHTHMTNTRITDPEILESRYPVVLRRFAVRRNSGGPGRFPGGDGIVREFEFKARVEVSLLSERRSTAPFGMEGGAEGKPGRNILVRDGEKKEMTGKFTTKVNPGDRLIIKTPGGGGWGSGDR